MRKISMNKLKNECIRVIIEYITMLEVVLGGSEWR